MDVKALNLYIAFLVVGCACGWLLVNSIYTSFATNYTSVQDSNFYGAATMIGSVVGLGLALLYAAFTAVRPDGLPLRGAQMGVAALCLLSVIGQIILAGWWSVRDAAGNYPVILSVFGIGQIVANLTFFIAFPLVTVHYGGWLMAPLRAGTDLSQMFSAMLSTVQAPLGGAGPHTFPAWILQASYAVLAAIGLAAWLRIVQTGIGLKEDVTASMKEKEESKDIENSGAEVKHEKKISCARFFSILRGFACPASLLGPVIFGGVVSQVCYWSLTQPVGAIAAKMIDPESCDGVVGSSLLKYANTAQYCLVPLGSILSSLGRCPRAVFYLLSIIQVCCVVSLWVCLLGIGRQEFWQTARGQVVFAISYPLVGGLEGYLLTMAYRYVGDDDGIAAHLRESASKLMSWAGVWVVNIASMIVGSYLLDGSFAC
jgi:hypothetical protein